MNAGGALVVSVGWSTSGTTGCSSSAPEAGRLLPARRQAETGEGLTQALCREIAEELGPAVVPSSIDEVFVVHDRAHELPGRELRMHCYRADTTGVPRLGREIAEMAWVGTASDGLRDGDTTLVAIRDDPYLDEEDLAQIRLLRDRDGSAGAPANRSGKARSSSPATPGRHVAAGRRWPLRRDRGRLRPSRIPSGRNGEIHARRRHGRWPFAVDLTALA